MSEKRTCSVDGCGKPHVARGWYSSHYEQWRRRLLTLQPGYNPSDHTCSVPGCGRVGQLRRGWCQLHYWRFMKYGSVERPGPTPWQRFMAKVDTSGPVAKNRPDLGRCWVWTACRKPNGYAYHTIRSEQVHAHRFAYEHMFGPVPDGLVLDHFACDNGAGGCVNPHHVRPVTSRENVLRGSSVAALCAAKTHCKWGHPFDEANTLLVDRTKQNRGIERRCVVCYRQQRKARSMREKARRAELAEKHSQEPAHR